MLFIQGFLWARGYDSVLWLQETRCRFLRFTHQNHTKKRFEFRTTDFLRLFIIIFSSLPLTIPDLALVVLSIQFRNWKLHWHDINLYHKSPSLIQIYFSSPSSGLNYRNHGNIPLSMVSRDGILLCISSVGRYSVLLSEVVSGFSIMELIREGSEVWHSFNKRQKFGGSDNPKQYGRTRLCLYICSRWRRKV